MNTYIKTRKSAILIFAILLVISSCNTGNRSEENNISISGAFALYPLTVRWAEEYKKENPDVRIDISAGGAGKGMTDALTEVVDLGMFSRNITKEELDKGAWYIAVSKDAVLPTMNSKNPYLKQIMDRGITKEEFSDIFITQDINDWGALLDIHEKKTMNVYTRADACGAAEMFAKYLGKNQEDLKGTGVFGDPGMADAVKKDIYAAGYNNDVYVYDIRTGKKFEGLEVIPIDLNGDGKINEEERFYDSLDEFMTAIKLGKYPEPPARDLYFVAHGKPGKQVVQDFLKWILTDGQKYVVEAGYVQLRESQIQEELKKIR